MTTEQQEMLYIATVARDSGFKRVEIAPQDLIDALNRIAELESRVEELRRRHEPTRPSAATTWTRWLGCAGDRSETMAKFEISIEGQPDTVRVVGAARVRKAVELYWNERIIEGRSSAATRTRLIVKHPDGPNVDPATLWHMKDGAVFAMVDVQVASVEVGVFDVDAREAMRERPPAASSAIDALERRVRGWVGIRD